MRIMRILVSLLIGIGIEGMTVGVVYVKILVLGSVETAEVQARLRGEGMMGVGEVRLVVLLESRHRGLRLKSAILRQLSVEFLLHCSKQRCCNFGVVVKSGDALKAGVKRFAMGVRVHVPKTALKFLQGNNIL